MLQRSVDPAAVEAESERVHSPPKHLAADLLQRVIADRIREEALGTLDNSLISVAAGTVRAGGHSVVGWLRTCS